MFLILYCLGFAVVILLSIYMDISHYKQYKSLPIDPFLLGGLIIAIVWPFALLLLLIALIMGSFSIVYNKLINFLAK